MSNTNDRIAIDAQWLRANYAYDPETGFIDAPTRILNTGNVAVRVSGLPGSTNKFQELVGGRFAYAYVTGEDPGEMEVLYKNGDRTDLSFTNLELGTPRTRTNKEGDVLSNCVVRPDGWIVPLAHCYDSANRKQITRRLRWVKTVEEKNALVNGAKAVKKAAELAGEDVVAAFLDYCKVHTCRKTVVKSEPTDTPEVTDESV
jgi:hypothetical protein